MTCDKIVSTTKEAGCGDSMMADAMQVGGSPALLLVTVRRPQQLSFLS